MKVSRSLCFQRLPREEYFYRHQTSSPALANFPSRDDGVCRELAGACWAPPLASKASTCPSCRCGQPASLGPVLRASQLPL